MLRFRPILMTTMAAMLGAVPLAVGTGVGAELRRPLGITIIGGLIMSQMLTLYTTPVVYLYFDRLQHWWSALRLRRRNWMSSTMTLMFAARNPRPKRKRICRSRTCGSI